MESDARPEAIVEGALIGSVCAWRLWNRCFGETYRGIRSISRRERPRFAPQQLLPAGIILDGLYSTRRNSPISSAFASSWSRPMSSARRLAAREGADFMRIWQPVWDAREDYYSQLCPRRVRSRCSRMGRSSLLSRRSDPFNGP